MTGSLYNGISGLNTHQKALDVESNNISNVNTVGYKSDTIKFADLMYQNGVGTGVNSASIFKLEDVQGTIKQTGNPYDFAIVGDGYFMLTDPDDVTEEFYTRSGNFKMGTTGLLETVEGMNVMGIPSVVTGDKITDIYSKYITSAVIEDDTMVESINIYATDYTSTAVDSGTSGTNYKTKSSNINDIEQLILKYDEALSTYATNPEAGTTPTYQQNTIEISPLALPTSGNYDLSITVDGRVFEQSFDTDIETTLKLFSDQISTATGVTSSVDTATGILTIDSLIPAEEVIVTDAMVNQQDINIVQDQDATGSGLALMDEFYNQLTTLVGVQNGSVAKNSSVITKSLGNVKPTVGTVQLNMDTLGMSENLFGDLSLEDGIIYLNDGRSKFAVAQIPPVNFSNPLALSPQGGNKYIESNESGEPIYVPNKSKVMNESLELSTVELSESLVNLMVYQKSFDANSKSITTSDQLLQTAINLKQK
jgi:flagellar hook protein FlgE